MHPHDLHIFGYAVSVWNTVFVVAVVLGAFAFHASARIEPGLRAPMLRYGVFVYLSALAAQVFAYAFDVNTSMTPPPGISYAAWYLSPVAGPKTLYGVIVLAPVSVAVATLGSKLRIHRALDLWTPAILVVLATVRVGCLLQGCCYGAVSSTFGVVFPAGSPVFGHQVEAGLIARDASAPLPVLPTQGLEAAFLAILAVWAIRAERRGVRAGLFVPAVAAYSVFRFAIEFVRADAGRGIYAGLATSQWIALVVLAMVAVARMRELDAGGSGIAGQPARAGVERP